MAALNKAMDVLGDPTRRSAHDAWLKQAEDAAISAAIEEALAATHASSSSSGSRMEAPPTERTTQQSSQPPHAVLKQSFGSSAIGRAVFASMVVLTVAYLYLGAEKSEKRRLAAADAATAEARAAYQASQSKPPSFDPSTAEPAEVAPKTTKDTSRTSRSGWGAGDQVVSTARPATAASPARQLETPQEPKLEPGFLNRWSPTGNPWPRTASYITGLPRRAGPGRSLVTIDNSQGGADVHVKLCGTMTWKCDGLRNIYVPRGGKFTMTGIRAGSYDIRYRNLDDGRLAKSESFDLQEVETERGVRYSSLVLTLYVVKDGNTHFSGIAEADF